MPKKTVTYRVAVLYSTWVSDQGDTFHSYNAAYTHGVDLLKKNRQRRSFLIYGFNGSRDTAIVIHREMALYGQRRQFATF